MGSSEGQGRDRSERASGRNNTKRGGGDRESAKRSNFLRRTLDRKNCVLPFVPLTKPMGYASALMAASAGPI